MNTPPEEDDFVNELVDKEIKIMRANVFKLKTKTKIKNKVIAFVGIEPTMTITIEINRDKNIKLIY